MVTMKEIAAASGVSQPTVSIILNNKSDACRVSKKTQLRVKEVAKQRGYVPNAIAQSMKTGKTDIIGYLFDYKTTSNIIEYGLAPAQIVQLEVSLLEKGYNVLISALRDDVMSEKQLPKIVANGLVDGILLNDSSMNMEYVKWLYERFPYLVVMSVAPEGVPAVLYNNEAAGALMAEHFWQNGCRSFAFIGSEDPDVTLNNRLKGFSAKINELAGGKLNIPFFADDRWHKNAGVNGVKEMREQHYTPDAVFCVNDFYAWHVMDAFLESGIVPGKDIAVGACDNLRPSEFTNISLTTIDHNMEYIGRKAAEMLCDIIKNNGKTPSGRAIQQYSIEKLIIRESSRFQR